MRIIVDAMGGDNAPRAIVEGSLAARREFGYDLTLVGDASAIRALLAEAGETECDGLRIEPTEDVIATCDPPTSVMKEHKHSSMTRALELLSQAEGDAMVSAGNSGALLCGATFICKRIKGIRRAAFAPILPTDAGGSVLVDSGANSECTPEFLLQFGLLGSAYAESVLHRASPEVALLNIGAEEEKGSPLYVEAHRLLKEAAERGELRFAGNVEAREVMTTSASVIVADGFAGNVLLKTVEGVGLYFAGALKGIFYKNVISKLAALLVMSGIRGLKKKMDYKEVGGAPLLGIAAPVIKAHGSSDGRAFRSAVRQAAEYAASGVIAGIGERAAKAREN